ncbi:NUDIX domain-containing protein [Candidatus Roizmanbacteria bacterium]|nr:NUDIX domain-containing protein [Candidatus Roizmanbacteria bacterium]
MKSQYEKITSVLDYASHVSHIDKPLLEKFYTRLKQGKLVRDENPDDHFSTFFIPFVQKTKYVFMGDHIKSGVWLVPGGHIDRDEHPVDTIIREIKEELDTAVTEKDIEFFDITITNINSSYPCKRHYDLWYLYRLRERVNFNYTKEEFKVAKWMNIEEAGDLLQDAGQTAVLGKLSGMWI